MYIEEVFAEIIRRAAGAGRISELAPGNVFTDLNGTNEWKGQAKLYVTRENTSLIEDLQGEYGYSGHARSTVSLAAIGKNKHAAARIIKDALAAVRRYLNHGPGHIDTFTEGPEDLIEIEDGDLFAVDYLEGALDAAEIEDGDAAEIDAEDVAVFGTIEAKGTVTGAGWITAAEWTGRIQTDLVYVSAAAEITSWRLAGAAGIERFDAGSWAEQYFSTKTIDAMHRVEVE